MEEKCPKCGKKYPFKTSKAYDPNYIYHECDECGHEWRDKKSYLPSFYGS
ncbi:MAG: hypothetical protein FWE29_05615 [Defluviitaleaceae bacterium]|nr:hypothetical protein [Defluviitaleaceae bacterium]